MNCPGDPQRYGPQPLRQVSPGISYSRPAPNQIEARFPSRGPAFILNVVVGLLGIVGFCLGFAPYAKSSSTGSPSPDNSESFFDNASGAGVAGLSLVLAAGLIALLNLLPKQASNGPVVAGLSLAGFLSSLLVMVGLDAGLDVGTGLILFLVSSFLQAVLSLCSVLETAGVLRLGASARFEGYPPRPGGYPPGGNRPGVGPYQGPGPR
jgi:hypothetical protein